MQEPLFSVTWQALSAICVFLTLVGTAAGLYVNHMLKTALLEFELRLYERLDERYVTNEVCNERHRPWHTIHAESD
jgi:hypothetical protein